MTNKYSEILESITELVLRNNMRKQLEDKYCYLIKNILDECTINGSWVVPHTKNIYRLGFKYYSRTNKIIFTDNICNSSNNLDKFELDMLIQDTESAIRYLVDIEKIDDFLKYLLDVVIPAYQKYEYISDSLKYYFEV